MFQIGWACHVDDDIVTTLSNRLSMQALKEASSYGSIIVSRQPETLPPVPTEAAPSQPEAKAESEKEVPSAQIIEFSKAA